MMMVGSSGEVALLSPVMIIQVLRDMPASMTQRTGSAQN